MIQRKRPVIRVGPRLAGLPPDEPAPMVHAKPGPKPKHGTAMTALERQRARRARKQHPEKLKLVAAILKIQKRALPTPSKSKIGQHNAEDIRADNRTRLLRLGEDLMQQSLSDLQKYLDTLEQSPDSRGRIHGEEKTGKKRPGEQSTIDTLPDSTRVEEDLIEGIDERRMSREKITANRFLNFLKARDLNMERLELLPIEKQQEIRALWSSIWGG
jgi:hypothetical protein